MNESRRLIQLYYKNYGLIHHHISSYNNFIEYTLPLMIKHYGNIELPNQKFTLNMSNLYVINPTYVDIGNHESKILPIDAKNLNLTYEISLYVDVDININGTKYSIPKTLFAYVPAMVGSNYCNRSIYSKEDLIRKGECEYDIGGYFILSGMEKVIISQERSNYNKIYIYRISKQSYEYYAESRSSATVNGHTTMTCAYLKNSSIEFELPYFNGNTISATVLFKALGVEYENDMIRYILPKLDNGKYDQEYLEFLMPMFLNTCNITTVKHAQQRIAKLLRNSESKDLDIVHNLLQREFLPHLGSDIIKKRYYVGLMIYRLVSVSLGKQMLDDRDHYQNKRVDTVGPLLSVIFFNALKKFKKSVSQMIHRELERKNYNISIKNIFNSQVIHGIILLSMNTGNWSGGKTGVCQTFDRHNYISSISNLRKICSPLGNESRIITPRKLHNTQWMKICPVETPEGKNTGLIKNMAMSTFITIGTDDRYIYDLVQSYIINFNDALFELKDIKLFINGDWIGNVNSLNVINDIKDKRRSFNLDYELSVSYDEYYNEIRIYTDSGRVSRPLIIVHDGKTRLDKLAECETWYDVLRYGIVEMVDADEEESTRITDIKKFNTYTSKQRKQFTHLEISYDLLLGASGTMIPFPDHNQSPRNIYQASMGKQAIGIPCMNYRNVTNISQHILCYVQKPLLNTKNSEIFELDVLPAGQNPIVAISVYTGYNQEDSVIMNKSSVQRGLFRSMYCINYKIKFNKQELAIPTPNDKGYKSPDLSKLDPDGIINKGEIVTKGTVMVCKRKESDGIWYDESVVFAENCIGSVDMIMIGTDGDGNDFVKIKIVEMRIPIIGDKFASRSAQKGTIGMMYNQEDMPFTKDGITPDIIINPAAIPSRMTIGQLIESLVGKIITVSGKKDIMDATPFEDFDINKLKSLLHELGYSSCGDERLYNGFTGELMDSIFIGPTFYQRLKHMVQGKIHARARGPKTSLVRQPKEGRSSNGGLKYGEMERDCTISQGAAFMLKDRLFEQSDKYDCCICELCGIFATYDAVTNKKYCKNCGTNRVVDIKIPYATKLLIQELMVMNVMPRLLV